MVHIGELWWRAGRTAFSIPDRPWLGERWAQSLHRSAELLEPTCPGIHEFNAQNESHLPVTALVLYALFEEKPDGVSVDELLKVLPQRHADGPALDEAVLAGLTGMGHDLTDDSRMSRLARRLTRYLPPETNDLPAPDMTPEGSVLANAAGRVAQSIAWHHRGVDHLRVARGAGRAL